MTDRRLFLQLTVAACALTGVHGAEIYDFYLNMTYDRVDMHGNGNGDGKLQCSELSAFVNLMELQDIISANDVTTHCNNADTTGNDGISQDELVEYIKSGAGNAGYAELGDQIISKLTGAPRDGVASISTTADPIVEAAKSIVDVELVCNSHPENVLPSERKQIKTNLIAAIAPGTPSNAVFVRFVEGSMIVKAKFFLPTAADAANAEAAVGTNLGSASAAGTVISAGLTQSLTVTSTPTVTTTPVLGIQELKFAIPAAIAGFAVFLLLFSCFLASYVAKKKVKAMSVQSTSCCATGCCSGYAINGWAWAVVFGCAFLAVGAALLFMAMDDTTQGIKCILDNIIALGLLPAGSDAREAISSIEGSLEILDSVRSQIDLLNIAVILPALFAILLLLLGALCSCRSSKSACCAKIFMVLSSAVLILCIVFYSIFAGLAAAVQFESVTEQLTVVTTLCETTAPTLEQTFQDLTAALSRAASAPPGAISAADLADYQQKLDDAEPAFRIFQSTCVCISAIFNEFVDLFIPGIVSTLAAIVAFVANFYLCCAAGCCKSPNVGATAGKQPPAELAQSV